MRRKAYAGDKSAPSDNVQFLQDPRVYWRRDGAISLLTLPGEVCWAPRRRKAVERKNES